MAAFPYSTLNLRVKTFIEEVQKYEFLYNVKNSDYRDMRLKENTWLAIGKKFSFDAATSANKWRSIRDRYAKELRKQDMKPSAGRLRGSTVICLRSKWPYMECLAFLREHVVPRRRIAVDDLGLQEQVENNLDLELEVENNTEPVASSRREEEFTENLDEIHTADEATGDENSQYFTQSPTFEPTMTCSRVYQNGVHEVNRASSPCHSSTSAKRKFACIEEQLANIIETSNKHLQALHQASSPEIDDEAYHFAMIIAKRLRTFSPKKRAFCQLKIQETMFNLEFAE